MGKINVKITSLRLREKPSLKATSLGYVTKGIHEFTETAKADNYLWYHIEKGWCAYIEGDVEEIKEPWVKPVPTIMDLTKDQVKVSTVGLRIRATASYNGEIKDYCDQGYYNVLEVVGSFAHIGKDAYIALQDKSGCDIEGVKFIKGTSDPDINVLRQEVAEIRAMLEACINSGEIRSIRALSKEDYNKEKHKNSTLYILK